MTPPGPDPAPPPSDALARARQAAFRLLAVRDRSTGELESRLLARHPPAAVARVLEELAGAGYLDDARLARRLAERYLAERDFGPARIRHELRRRGLAAAAAEAVEAPDPEAVAAAALRATRRYLRGRPPALDEAAVRRLAGHLERRGFPADTIRGIVRRSREGRLWDDV